MTGGTGGIGSGIVELLAARGHRVAFSGRDAGRGGELAARTGAAFVQHDATRPAAELVDGAVSALGGLDALILNAGVIALAPLLETGADDFARTLSVNVGAPLRELGAALPELARGDDPCVVAIASNAGLWGETAIAAYSLSKAALIAAVQGVAARAHVHGVRANAVCPGDTEPGMAVLGAEAIGVEMFELLPPVGRLGRARDSAEVVAFLAEPRSAFVNGATVLVDGGMHATLDAGRWR